MNLSRSQLFRKLKAVTGLTPVEFLRKLRLQTAKTLMEKPGFSVIDIAESVGYNDPAYFRRCFSKEYGITPTRYLNQLHSHDES